MSGPPIPSLDLTGLDAVPFAEIAGDFEALLEDAREERVDALDGLLLGRALRLLMEGTRSEALDEAVQLARLLDSAVGDQVHAIDPIAHGAWHGYRQLLTEAARRSDPLFTDSLLRSTSGNGEKVLQILAEAEGPVPRTTLAQQIKTSDSNLSHLLRNLEQGELVLRTRSGRRVYVELGRVGQEIVDERFRPRWLTRAIELLDAPDGSLEVADRDRIEVELTELGAPSRLVARQLASALSRHAVAGPAPADRRIVEEASTGDDDGRLAALSAGEPPGRAWSRVA